MKDTSISIIGGGNLGSSIASGLLASGIFSHQKIHITRRNLEKLQNLADQGAVTGNNNVWAVENADIVILAVKPFKLMEILQEISPALTKDKIIVSVVSGVGIQEIEEALPMQIPLFRAMPNTAISIKESMTCISSLNATKAQEEAVMNIFNQLGKVVKIGEEHMDAATVLGACGIAYALRFIRAASQGGIEIGFSAEVSQLIASQTVMGAAKLLLEQGKHPEEEIDKVTTPKGCTIAGLNEMEFQGFSSSLVRGILASYEKLQ
ncbi:pyrroline-5-carboxylate reductase [Aureibacter tunicatorum]|uniref:Pyrroline-5-carboxylate reductase n=1 Tax=Aureibacter tunicatorum TaxID=866807 RepID=A0AAE3XKC1_9BACT|nr:pyrroline-5-carboxylate reductase [Aureibacter tunicatorum]MDR6237578.1 pyrroline-5-carboxylate reductase [Aureibacter tunicatorum]BDD02612.1 pyrroline-5-carboxylate reductase [Aureibacter tunicatorum]